MDFGFSPGEEKFREEVHRFLEQEETTRKAREEKDSGLGAGPYNRELWKKLGAKGWLTPNWPKEYGGLELSEVYKYIVLEELDYFGIRCNLVASGMAGPIVLRYGNEEQKREYLPRISRGEIEFALGYTEPQAGSDLSSMELRAEEKDDHFILNGQKMFNTACHYAEYHWLMARTMVTTPKYKGFSFFIVDLKTPGVTIHPVWVMGGAKGTGMRTNQVFYDNVKVPKKWMVGEKNRGFYMLMEALAYERISATGSRERRLAELIEYVKKAGKNKNPFIRKRLVELCIDLERLKSLAMRVPWMLDGGIVPEIEAAMAKTITCEFEEKLANLEVDVLGPYGLLQKDSKWALFEGEAEWAYREFLINRITRGTPEVMRNIIATRGLGLPR